MELGAAGATVYVTGRTTRERRSEYDRPETIEDTADLVTAAGGRGIAVPTDHLVPSEVRTLVDRVADEQGRLDVLVNDVWGGERLFEWDTPVWEHDLDNGLRLLRLGIETHAITSHHALPLLLRRPGGLVVEMTDGTAEYNAATYRVSFFYDLAKSAVLRMAFALGQELGPRGATAVALTPGWLRSEMMLENFGVTEDNWRDALERVPHFGISETPFYVGRAVAALAADPERARWNGESLSSGGLARTYGFTDRDGSRPTPGAIWSRSRTRASRRTRPATAEAARAPASAPSAPRRRAYGICSVEGRASTVGRMTATTRFEGHGVLLTGAARGIGAATARRLAEEGAGVLVTDVDLAPAEKTAGRPGPFVNRARRPRRSASTWPTGSPCTRPSHGRWTCSARSACWSTTRTGAPRTPRSSRTSRRGLGARPRPHPDRRVPLLPRRTAPPGGLGPRRHRQHRVGQRPPGLRRPRVQRVNTGFRRAVRRRGEP